MEKEGPGVRGGGIIDGDGVCRETLAMRGLRIEAHTTPAMARMNLRRSLPLGSSVVCRIVICARVRVWWSVDVGVNDCVLEKKTCEGVVFVYMCLRVPAFA